MPNLRLTPVAPPFRRCALPLWVPLWVLVWLIAFAPACTCTETDYIVIGPDAAEDADETDGQAEGGIEAGTEAPCDWIEWRRGVSGGTVATVAFDPRNTTRAYGAAGTRVSESVDRGENWSPRATNETVRRFAFPTSDASLILAASARGVVESTDGGATWAVRALSGLNVTTLEVAKTAPLRVYAAVDVIGVVRSLDGGASWASVVAGLPYSRVQEIAVDPSNESHVLIVAQEVTPTCGVANCSFLAETVDGGASWQIISGPHERVAAALAFCPANPDVIYAAVGDRLRVSDDGGESWADGTLALNLNVQGLGVGGPDCQTVYAAAFSNGVYRSTNGGATWDGPFKDTLEEFSVALSVDGLALDPTNPAHLFVATRTGAFESDDSGATWRLVQGLGTPPVRRIAIRSLPNQNDEVWLATWGTGLWKRGVGASTWTHLSAAEFPTDFVQTVAFSPTDPDVFMASLYLTEDGGASFTNTAAASSPFGVMDIQFDPNREGTLVVGTLLDGVKLRAANEDGFAAINGNLTPWMTEIGMGIDVRAVALIPGDEGHIVIGTNQRGFYVTEDDGETWTQSEDYADRIVESIVYSPVAGALFATLADAGVVTSADGGASWSQASTGLPSMKTSRIAVDSVTGTLFVGTGEGVYQSANGGTRWTPLGNASCIPDGLALPVVLRDEGRYWVLAASPGEGVYRYEP